MTVSPPPARILVVDDNEMNREMLSRRLSRQGHLVDMAENGRRALERARAGTYELMLLDVMMPELDGRQVLEAWFQDPVLKNIPVVMISASDETETIARCIELGADDYLPKPFDPVILQARVGASLEKKRLRDRERLHAESLERELAIGREIQATFLPEVLPQSAGWEVAARFEPARQCAGDFYDTFPLVGDRLGLVVSDVCDKGVGAALFMALFRTLIRATAERISSSGDSASTVLGAIASTNDYIARTHGRTNMFATIFFGIAELRSGELRFVNAGHESPLVLLPSGALSRVLAPTGPAVGLVPESKFETGATVLAPGETLFAYTDGVTDAKGEGGFFGRDRLLALAREPRATAGALLDAIQEAVVAHTGAQERYDDLTMLAVRRLS
jgi:sigma-B regulation protein RsbU (phosphoserine phosphatase)